MEYTTGKSQWLGFLSIKEYLTQGCNQVLEATPQSQLMEISYATDPLPPTQTQFG
jgi:hypothetical protein